MHKSEAKKSPTFRLGFLGCKSLTMTYFHTGTRTIIGAEAFHCPVRDGKEWYHLAMVIRHNFFVALAWPTQPIHRANQLPQRLRVAQFLDCVTWHNTLTSSGCDSERMIKVIG